MKKKLFVVLILTFILFAAGNVSAGEKIYISKQKATFINALQKAFDKLGWGKVPEDLIKDIQALKTGGGHCKIRGDVSVCVEVEGKDDALGLDPSTPGTTYNVYIVQ